MIGLAHGGLEGKTSRRKSIRKNRSKKREQAKSSKKRQEQANKVFFHKKITVSLNLTTFLFFVTRLGNF